MKKKELFSLEQEFFDRALLIEESRKKKIEEVKEVFPNQEIPDYLQDEFNLCASLYYLVVEVITLRQKLAELRETVEGWK